MKKPILGSIHKTKKHGFSVLEFYLGFHNKIIRMLQIQNKPFFLPLDCTEADKGLTTVGAESHSTCGQEIRNGLRNKIAIQNG